MSCQGNVWEEETLGSGETGWRWTWARAVPPPRSRVAVVRIKVEITDGHG